MMLYETIQQLSHLSLVTTANIIYYLPNLGFSGFIKPENPKFGRVPIRQKKGEHTRVMGFFSWVLRELRPCDGPEILLCNEIPRCSSLSLIVKEFKIFYISL